MNGEALKRNNGGRCCWALALLSTARKALKRNNGGRCCWALALLCVNGEALKRNNGVSRTHPDRIS